jgi:hypothetical protein
MRDEGSLAWAGGRIEEEGPERGGLAAAAEVLNERGARASRGGAAPVGRERATIMLAHEPGATRPQGYRLAVGQEGIRIVGGDAAGVFYGAQTLAQLIELFPRALPCLRIEDWPDFPNRGVLLDISRNRVPTMSTLFSLVDQLAGWKINQLQLYTEHTFAYRDHPQVWAAASPMTGEEIRELDGYCRAHFIELVPNQNSFAHLRPWLVHEPYRRLAECPDGCDTAWGEFVEPFTLFPSEESLVFIRSLYDELLPHFSSRQLNSGCDEPVDLGQGRSRAAVGERGLPSVYLEFVLRLYRDLKARGVTMQMWGDVIAGHPSLAGEIPQDLIVLEWGYEAEHPFDDHCRALAEAGIQHYVCPGTSSWNSIAGRTENAVANLRNAAESGLKHGALGYLVTDWGDNGHWQPVPVSYAGLGYGAAMAWAADANESLDLAAALDAHTFRDRGGAMGRLACELGDVHQLTGVRVPNGTSLFRVLQTGTTELRPWLASLPAGARGWAETRGRIEEMAEDLRTAQPECRDAALVGREYLWAAAMLRHACLRAMWSIGTDPGLKEELRAEAPRLIREFGELWRERSRPGGFEASLARLEAMRQDYE